MASKLYFRRSLVVLLAFYFALLAFDAKASENECLIYYDFNNESDIPDKNRSFFSEGWQFDETNRSLQSNKTGGESSFWTNRDGPLDVNFEWKISSEKNGIGVFQFQIDGIPFDRSSNTSWKQVTRTIPKGKHELKWIVYSGEDNNPFIGWIDSLCIRSPSCKDDCPRVIKANQTFINQKPKILSLSSYQDGPIEAGTIIMWAAMASDPDNDKILYKFLLNGNTVQDWSPNRFWNWSTDDSNLGDNTIEAMVRDGKHADIGNFDDRSTAHSVISVSNKKPTIINFTSDHESPIEINTQITCIAEAYDPENDNILYKFFINDSAVNDWNSENFLTWTANHAGLCRIEVWIRDGKHAGPESADNMKSLNIRVGISSQEPILIMPGQNKPPFLNSLTTNRSSPQEAGAIVLLKADAKDPDNDRIYYKFLINNADKTGWIDNDSWEWVTSSNDLGLNNLRVCIRDTYNAGIRGMDDEKYLVFEINNCIINISEIMSPDEVCSGSVNNASVKYDKNYNYSWSITNGYIISDSEKNSVIWVAGSGSYTDLEVAISNNNCESSSKKIKKRLRVNLIDAPNNILIFEPNSTLNLTEEISRCDCKTIRLERGNYSGPIIIKNSNIKLTSIYEHEAIINGSKNSRGIELIGVSNVELDRLKINGSYTGVALYNSEYCKLLNNNISARNRGIWIDKCHNNSVEDNDVAIFSDNDYRTTEVISLKNSFNNTIKNNRNASQCDYIYYLDESKNNIISYGNIGDIYCNGLDCKSSEINTICSRGENINNRGNEWEKLRG